jgi:hypothetical protein
VDVSNTKEVLQVHAASSFIYAFLLLCSIQWRWPYNGQNMLCCELTIWYPVCWAQKMEKCNKMLWYIIRITGVPPALWFLF